MADYMGAIPVVSLAMVQQSIMQAKLSANQERKAEAAKRLDYYNGDQIEHLEKVLRAQFSHPERLKLQMQFSNITRRVIDQVSVVYKRAPQRRLTLAGKPVEGKPAEAYQRMVERAKLNSVLKKVNRYANLLNTVGLMPVWRNDHLELDILTPDIMNVVQDPRDPCAAAAVIIEMAFADTVALDDPSNPYGAKRLFITWTPTEHAVFDENGYARVGLANEQGVNPYGVIPITWFRDAYPDGYFWADGTNDLVNAQEALNVKLTQLNQLIKMQSFSIPVIIGDAPAEGITVDPSNWISIPLGDAVAGKGQPDFKFVSPDPKIGELLEAIREDVVRIAGDWGLSADQFKLTGSVSSGLSLKLQNIRLLERREDDVELYNDYEQDLFKKMRAVHNAHCAPGDKIDEKAELSVNFAELNFPEDPAAEDARWAVYVTNNIKSRAQWLMAVDPDVKTSEEAEKRLLENREINERTRNAMLGGADPLNPGEDPEDESEGENGEGEKKPTFGKPDEKEADA